jgi:hypothetical protein
MMSGCTKFKNQDQTAFHANITCRKYAQPARMNAGKETSVEYSCEKL